jgi:hypothetical protein
LLRLRLAIKPIGIAVTRDSMRRSGNESINSSLFENDIKPEEQKGS